MTSAIWSYIPSRVESWIEIESIISLHFLEVEVHNPRLCNLHDPEVVFSLLSNVRRDPYKSQVHAGGGMYLHTGDISFPVDNRRGVMINDLFACISFRKAYALF